MSRLLSSVGVFVVVAATVVVRPRVVVPCSRVGYIVAVVSLVAVMTPIGVVVHKPPVSHPVVVPLAVCSASGHVEKMFSKFTGVVESVTSRLST